MRRVRAPLTGRPGSQPRSDPQCGAPVATPGTSQTKATSICAPITAKPRHLLAQVDDHNYHVMRAIPASKKGAVYPDLAQIGVHVSADIDEGVAYSKRIS